MNRISNFFSDQFRPILGGKNYEAWKKDSLDLQEVVIKNKKLALELELECKNKGGFLTYGEYIQIDQFGTHGYHATHKAHGFTPSFKNWIYPVFTYLKENNIHEIVEIGPGDANLAYHLFLLCEKEKFQLTWNAAEVSDIFRDKIKIRFQKQFKKYIGAVAKTVEELPQVHKALIISSFCIDSIPPEIFINTSFKKACPNSVIGIKIQDGKAIEFILNQNQLKTRGIMIDQGTVTYHGTSFDISSWILSPMQRAYITIPGFKTLHNALQKVKDPSVLVVDEVRASTAILRADHILPPLYLNVKNRHRFNPNAGYLRSGEMLYYYPFYLDSLTSMLDSLGFQNIESDIEPRLAARVGHLEWKTDGRFRLYLCYGILASQKNKKSKKIILSTPQS